MTVEQIPKLSQTNLFKPIQVGSVKLENRVVEAPLSRYRNTSDFVATDIMLQNYADRSKNNGGLLITEATFISEQAGLYEHGPGIWNDRQAQAWKKIVEKVHENGSKFSMQLWNLGRAADPALLKKFGKPFLSSSANYMSEDSEKAAKEAGNEIKAATIEDIEKFKQEYLNAARNALDVAGFDIIELHGAHGYLFDQFLQPESNQRTDKYGGSIENRARFLLEVIDLLLESFPAEKLAVRLSPYAQFQGIKGADSIINPIATFGYVLSELERRAKDGKRLAYVSIVEPRVSGDVDASGSTSYDSSWIGEIWKGIIIRAGSYLSDKGYKNLIRDVNADERTLIGIGRYFISNPDLVYRLKNGLELNEYDRSTFYGRHDNIGYNTWKNYGEVDKATENLDSSNAISKPIPLA
ncbi:oxidoreductase activity, acting on other nitrogenous compounds as donors protein [[Candida] boidinii]|nr:oxidoreductase activity, acting on other nitrogenous compounds as donors protein [[Candida] boidinii]